MSAVVAANILKREQAIEDAKPKLCVRCGGRVSLRVGINPMRGVIAYLSNQYWCSNCWRAAMKCDPR